MSKFSSLDLFPLCATSRLWSLLNSTNLRLWLTWIRPLKFLRLRHVEGEEDLALPEEGDTTVASQVSPQTVFLSYLTSPIVTLNIIEEGTTTSVSAHKAILERSPFFAEQFDSSDSLSIDLEGESLDAIGCFLQYQYTGEYFPRRIASAPDGLEHDPSLPSIDDTGAQLLKHARVYTLARKLGMPDLKNLAHSKIHRINSTAIGEIAYARYVYGNTPVDDVTIRKPVAAFWATRSHVLRHDAEDEFRKMCLEYPQFGFDVLSLVLDQREKRQRERESGVTGESAEPSTAGPRRKRMRPSVNV